MQRTIRFDLADIAAVVCECTACGTRLSLSLKRLRVASLSKCPSCSVEWFDEEPAHGSLPLTDGTANLLLAFRRAVEQPTTRAVRISFECAPLSPPAGD